MASTVNKLVHGYNYIFTDFADPRTNHYFLLPSPWPILAITGLYVYFCTSFGPRYMKDKQPYNLKNVVLVYNMFQVLMSTYLFYEGFIFLSSEKSNFRCEPVDYSDDPRAVRVASATWWYFFSKVTELLDTIFFVLRKKNSHISFLHVYHHSVMALTMWIAAKYITGGHGVLMGTLNAFVHIVMYTYYLIAGLGPQYQKYIWWKKHVTVLQLAQFVVILFHNLIPLFSDCSFPKILNMLLCFNSILFINLFGRFFYANYIKGGVKVKATNGTTKNGSITNGTAKNGSITNGTAKIESASNGIVKNRKHENGSTYMHSLHENEPEKNGALNRNT